MTKQRETWNSHWGMIAAMIGTAIGLGNIWRFPYLCGKYGGATFLIPYIILLFGVAIFAMMCEWVLGRHTKREPLGAFDKIKFPFGRDIGAWGIVGPFFLYSYYIVITSWVLFFVFASFEGLYFGKNTETFFASFLGSKWIFLAHFAAVCITSGILAMGVQKGIERACKIMIPTLFVLLIVVVIRSVTLPGANEGIEFYMRPRWGGLLNIETWVAALGQVFFTLSLGMGAMLLYGSYMKDEWGIPMNAISVTLGNTSASILAGFAIFPAAFALGFGAVIGGAKSIGLTFFVLPKVFEVMPGGHFFGGIFFILLAFGAISSAISIQEPAIAWLKAEVGWSRKEAALFTGIILWIMGLPFLLNGFVKGGLGAKLALLSKMDIIIGQLAIPIFGILAIIAVGYFMGDRGFDEMNKNARVKLSHTWIKFWIKAIVPIFVAILFILTLLKILQENGVIPAIILPAKEIGFTPIGITPMTVFMIIFVCVVFWGGFIYTTAKVLTIEKDKKARVKRGLAHSR
ncbi:MAG: sodium-dependent transporter [Candidatus Omnitrophica bacterium]|nr:sodium-dependent transporter [Candidatus Omnitrophota bacterium]